MSTKKNRKLVSLVVPCFNEEEALPIFYDETSKVLMTLDYNYELILVNDGSKDNTLDVMKELAKKDKNVKYISFSRNFGKESAMYAGICNAKGDYVGFIDADLQHPPFLIKEMLKALQDDKYDCAACRRVDRTGDSKVRTWFARKFYKIVNMVSDAQMVDGAGDFRLMKRNMTNSIISMGEYSRFSKGIFSWVGYNTYWINYENVDRVAGTTSWKFWKLVKYAIDGIINFSSFPLTIPIWLGLLMLVIALIMLISMIFANTTYITTIAFIILLSSGIQLLCLGIVGEYIGKTYTEVRNRPIYIIRETNIKENFKDR